MDLEKTRFGMVLAARERAWRIAAVTTVASVVGGGLGYLIVAGLATLLAC